jgi:hypothetical protein
LTGDFYAQNTDVTQPGPIAPFYERFGHTLDAISSTGQGDPDMMILTGGYTPEPLNDLWVTLDGFIWFFAGLAPWSPRGWHASTVFNGTLWIMGGSPLNNEVWQLTGVTPISRTGDLIPLTRSM